MDPAPSQVEVTLWFPEMPEVPADEDAEEIGVLQGLMILPGQETLAQVVGLHTDVLYF
jgi:hypothetical protein